MSERDERDERDEGPLDADVAALFAAERAVRALPDAHVERELARVTTRLGVTATTATTAGVAVGKVVAIALTTFVLGAATGAAVVARVRDAEPGPAPAPTPVASTENTAPPPPIEIAPPTDTPVQDLPSAPEPAVPSARRVPSPSSAPPSPPANAVEEERAMLDAANAALRSGDPATALTHVRRHEAAHPRGAFEEERESLAVRALAASGDLAAARARADRFRERFPASPYRARVDRATSQDASATF